MGSDHLPILTTVICSVTTKVRKTKPLRWKKKGDMPSFTATVEEQISYRISQSKTDPSLSQSR